MGIRDDFKLYFDGNGLLAPNPGTWISGQRGSDNGPCFTSEYYIILNKSGELTPQDKLDFAQKIGQCIGSEGILNRVPVGENDGMESVDDNYGVLNGSIELDNIDIPRKILGATMRYKGSLDNVSPGTWQFKTFLIRQPQLLCAMISAAFPSKLNPLHWLVRLVANPLFAITAVIIATSCIDADLNDTDARRLAWHLQNNAKKTSLMCWLASKIWFWRLEDDYDNGMRSVASLYYQPQGDNPYEKWWIT